MVNFLINKLNIFHKIFSSKKISYSFSGVDLIINNIFRDNQKGFYVDVGCQHPIKNNNTYMLYKKGWHGVNIDLDKDNIDLFNIARPNDLNVNIAVSDKQKEVDLFFYHKKSPINTIDANISKFQKARVSSIKKIQTDTLTKIINKSEYRDKRIDLLSIDVEGHELNVLKGLDFKKYYPKIIIVEFLDLSANKLEIKNLNIEIVIKSELYKFLISKGYILTNNIYSDLVFANKDFRD